MSIMTDLSGQFWIGVLRQTLAAPRTPQEQMKLENLKQTSFFQAKRFMRKKNTKDIF